MHLIRRFFGFLTASPLDPAEQREVRGILRPDLAREFFLQRPEDQRHALDVLRAVGGHDDLAEAALMHDIGKTASDLGAIGRSLATIWSALGFTPRGRWLTYVDHGEIGATLLEQLGAGDLTVAFARFHPGPPPPGVDTRSWHLLESADNV
ncbi:MAG: hypothetical protein ABFR95_02575 [Actinomycetota bacterium]